MLTTMKRNLLVALVAAGLVSAATAAEKPELKDINDKFTYALGVNYGKYLQRQGLEINWDIFKLAVQDVLSEGNLLLTDADIQQVGKEMQPIIQAKAQARQKEQAEKNKKEGDAFLAENKKKPGVITLPSGLQYKVLKEGTGPIPTTNDVVQTHYVGTFINGKEFDSSVRRGSTYDTLPTGVIGGWTEALLKMKVGSKWQLFVPPELAYKEAGRGSIPPAATLLFDMELVGIKAPEAAKTPPAFITAPQPAGQPVTSDIIKVPSAEELKKGAKIEVIPADKVKEEAAKQKK
jgi:FKBP-type peptidyl-prolyl cis-trans isomerase FklB